MSKLAIGAAVILLTTCPCVAAQDNIPNRHLTPGEVVTVDKNLVCKHGYSKSVRKTTQGMKSKIYQLYGIENHEGYKIDHLVPLSLGGADSWNNIWPSNFFAGKFNANAKDRLELKIRKLVCSNELSVEGGQAIFLGDWRTGYDQYCPTRQACPAFKVLEKSRHDQSHR